VNRRRRRRGRVFLVAFGLTLAVLGGLLAFLVTSGPTFTVSNHSLPSTLPTYKTAWAKYVPSDVLVVSTINYSLIRQLNSSAVPAVNLLQLSTPPASITPNMVNSVVSVTYQTPNATVDVIYLTKTSFGQFAPDVARAYSQSLGNKPLFVYAANRIGNSSTLGWLALIPSDSIVAFAVGGPAARTALNLSLEASNSTIPNILQSTDVQQSVYIVNGTENHLSFAIQKFPGVVQTGYMTTISVDDVANSIHVSYVVKFQDSAAAKSQVDYMRTSYLSATSFAQYDQYLKATEYRPFSQMQFAVRLVG
jgi:hypothetical protein